MFVWIRSSKCSPSLSTFYRGTHLHKRGTVVILACVANLPSLPHPRTLFFARPISRASKIFKNACYAGYSDPSVVLSACSTHSIHILNVHELL